MAGQRRVRVAIVCGGLRPEVDGVADYAARLVEALPAAGVEPIVVTAADEPVPGGAADGDGPGVASGAPVVRATRRWSVAGTAAVARALTRLRPDVAHVQFAPSAFGFSPAVGILPVLLRSLPHGRVPLVTTVHEYGWWSWPPWLPTRAAAAAERRGWWDRETLTLAPRSRRLVTTNAVHADTVRARLGVEPVVIPLAPNVAPAGADPRAARAELRRRLDLAPDRPVLVFFGFVHPVKGLRYLLEALSLLRGAPIPGGSPHLVVAGAFTSLALPAREADGFRAELERRVRSSGLADAVTFTGHLPASDASRVLAAADAAVLPFTAGVTAKSGALLTAFAHGLPTVVTAADPPDPALVDGDTVVAVTRRRDGPALAAGIRRLLSDDALRRRVAAGGGRLAAGRTWPRVAAAHARLYAEVVDGAAGR